MEPSDAHLHYPMLEDEEWIRHQYLNRGREMSEIRTMIGCSRSTLDWWLDRYGIEVRDDVTYRELYDAGWLEQMYHGEELDVDELREEIGCSRRRLITRLRELGIASPEQRRQGEPQTEYPELYDESWLEQQYIEEGLTSQAISERLGCAPSTVRDRLSEFGIRKRDHPAELTDERWLTERYVVDGLSDREISELIDVSPSRVRSARNRFDIRRPSAYPKLRDRAWLRRQWEDELRTPGEIGELAGGASSNTVRDWLDKHDLF